MEMNFDDIARQIFGAKADEYKDRLQKMSPNQIEELKQQFVATPDAYRKSLMDEITKSLDSLKNTNAAGPMNGPAFTKVRY